MSSIVEQLISEKWVEEGAVSALPRGRRPAMLELSSQIAVIAIDIHPVQAAVAVIDFQGSILSHMLVPVVSDPASTVARLIEQAKALIERFPRKSFQGIGVSLPGRVDPDGQHLIFNPNLKWPMYDIKKEIENGTGLKVELDNRANACLRSEMWLGRLEGVRNAVLIWVSEGIGTGILINGQILSGLSGMAGEFGHVPLDSSGPACACGTNGCWETFGSRRAALRYYAELAPQAKRISYPDLIRLAEEGDSAALGAISKQAEYIGRGLRMITAALSPEVILIAGDIITGWHFFAEAIESKLAAGVLAGAMPRLIPTHEGDFGLRGAAALILQRTTRGVTPGLLAQRAHARAM